MTPDQLLALFEENRRQEEMFIEDFDKAMLEHEAEVAACGGHREFLHQRCGMSYEQIDEFTEMIQRVVKEALAGR